MVNSTADRSRPSPQSDEHGRQFFDTVIGWRGDGLVAADADADDGAVGQAVAINEDAITRLVGAIPLEQSDETPQRHFRRQRS